MDSTRKFGENIHLVVGREHGHVYFFAATFLATFLAVTFLAAGALGAAAFVLVAAFFLGAAALALGAAAFLNQSTRQRAREYEKLESSSESCSSKQTRAWNTTREH